MNVELMTTHIDDITRAKGVDLDLSVEVASHGSRALPASAIATSVLRKLNSLALYNSSLRGDEVLRAVMDGLQCVARNQEASHDVLFEWFTSLFNWSACQAKKEGNDVLRVHLYSRSP